MIDDRSLLLLTALVIALAVTLLLLLRHGSVALVRWVLMSAQVGLVVAIIVLWSTRPASAESAPATADTMVEDTPVDDLAIEATELVSEEEDLTTCSVCTPDERLQLRLRRSRGLAAEVRSLIEEVSALSDAEQLLTGLLNEESTVTGQDLLMAIQKVRQARAKQAAEERDAEAKAAISRQAAPDEPKPDPGDSGPAGMYVLFAQAADAERDIAANVIVRVGRKDYILEVGETFSTDGETLKVSEVREDENGLAAVVVDQAGRERVLPWE